MRAAKRPDSSRLTPWEAEGNVATRPLPGGLALLLIAQSADTPTHDHEASDIRGYSGHENVNCVVDVQLTGISEEELHLHRLKC